MCEHARSGRRSLPFVRYKWIGWPTCASALLSPGLCGRSFNFCTPALSQLPSLPVSSSRIAPLHATQAFLFYLYVFFSQYSLLFVFVFFFILFFVFRFRAKLGSPVARPASSGDGEIHTRGGVRKLSTGSQNSWTNYALHTSMLIPNVFCFFFFSSSGLRKPGGFLGDFPEGELSSVCFASLGFYQYLAEFDVPVVTFFAWLGPTR